MRIPRVLGGFVVAMLTASAVYADAPTMRLFPVVSGRMGGRTYRTTVDLRNHGAQTAECRFELRTAGMANAPLVSVEVVPPGAPKLLDEFLRELSVASVIRATCSGDVEVYSRIHESADGGSSFTEGRLFRAFPPNEVAKGETRTIDSSTDLVIAEVRGETATLTATFTAQKDGSTVKKTYELLPYGERLLDVTSAVASLGPLRVALAATGEGAIVIAQETRDPKLADRARRLPNDQREAFERHLARQEERAVSAAAVEPQPPITPRLFISPFKAAPFQEPATGLVFMRDRWYDPSTGTFLSPDRRGYADSSNPYIYCAGDPVNCTDPTGQAASVSRTGVIIGIRPNGTRYRVEPGADSVEALRILESDPDISPAAEQEDILARAGIPIPYSSGPRRGEMLIGSASPNYRRYTHPPHGGRGDYLVGAIMPGDLPASTQEMAVGNAQAQVVIGASTALAVPYAGTLARQRGGGRAALPMTAVAIDGLRIEVPGAPPPGLPMTNAQVRQWYLDQEGRIPTLNGEWMQRGVGLEMRARLAFGIRYQARMTARQMMTDPSEVAQLRARDLQKYGSVNGPTFDLLVEQLRAAGLHGEAIYEEIIRSSTRTDPETNQRFGLK